MVDFYKNILVVESSIFKDENEYNYLRRTKQISIVRSGKNRPALISYESLPQKVKERIGIKNPYETVKRKLLESYIEHDVKISDYFENYKLPDGRHLKLEKQTEYYYNAIVMEGVSKMLNEKQAIRNSKGKKLKINWAELSEGVMELDRKKFPHNLPASQWGLKDILEKYKSEGCEGLINKRFNNKNSVKIKTKEQQAILLKALSNENNLDGEQIAFIYNEFAKVEGWKTITGAAARVWLDKHRLETTPGRRGMLEFTNTMGMKVKRDKPSCPLYFWSLDGWDVELLFSKYRKDKKGHLIKTVDRLTAVVVMDPYCNYPVGYAVGEHESHALIMQALRDAVNHTKELFGNYYSAWQLQSDHYGIKPCKICFEEVAKYITPARVKKPWPKPIEPYFKTLNKYAQLHFSNWSGFGMQSQKDRQPNVEWINAHKNEFPDEQGVRKQIAQMIEAERSECIEAFMQGWNRVPSEDKLPINREKYLMNFGEARLKPGDKTEYVTNRLTNGYFAPKILGTERYYDTFDLNFRKNIKTDWIVKYDPEDLNDILVVNKEGTLRFLLQDIGTQPMALKDRKDGDAERLARVQEFNDKTIPDYVTDFNVKRDEVLENYFLGKRELKDTFQKFCITDSTGQHKNIKNKERRLALAEPVEVENDNGSGRMEWLQSKVDVNKYLELETA